MIVKKVEIIRCPCGDEVCDTYGLSVGVFSMGSGFDKETAEHIAKCINAWEAAKALKEAAKLMKECRSRHQKPCACGIQVLSKAVFKAEEAGI